MHSINDNHLLLLCSHRVFFPLSWVVLAKLCIITLGNTGAENLISFPDSSIPVGSDTTLACWWGGSGNTIALLSLTHSQLVSQTQSAKKILHSLQKCHQDLRGADLGATTAQRTAVITLRDLAVPPQKHFSQFSSLLWKNLLQMWLWEKAEIAIFKLKKMHRKTKLHLRLKQTFIHSYSTYRTRNEMKIKVKFKMI